MVKYSRYKYHIAAACTVTVWGVTFISSKILLNNGLDPAMIFLLRFSLAYICIWSVAHKRLFATSWRDEGLLALCGLSGGSFYFLCENVALIHSPAANVSLIVCTAPLWTMLAIRLFYREEHLARRQILGSLLAFAGMALVVFNGSYVLHLSPRGDFLALGAALSWVVYSLIIRKIGHRYSSLFITRKVFFYGVLTIIPALFIRPQTISWEILARPAVWGNLLFLGLVASMLCYLIWNVVLRRLGTVRTNNYSYINPLATIIAAYIFLGEPITATALAGAAMILYGMWRAR